MRSYWIIPVLAFLALPAYGDIGAIGSPLVKPDPHNNPPPAAKKTAPAQEEVAEPTPASEALLTITFSQRHVYFDKMLRQAITAVESKQAGTSYEVVSKTPVGKTPFENQSLTVGAGQNLDDVLSALNDLGVGAARVHVTSESSDTITAQEISIYVGKRVSE